MKMNKINFKYFNPIEQIELETPKIVYSEIFNEQITLIKNNTAHFFDYCGFKIIKAKNTNQAIKELMFANNYESKIKINDHVIKNKDIIIISPFTRINDLLSSKQNNNVHNFLKQNKGFEINQEIEQFIITKLKSFNNELNDLIDYDLNKCDLINFIDIKQEFVDKNNIKQILEILKSYDQKKLIIFNDVDYISYKETIDYFQFFNFLYFINDQEINYTNIQNYELYLIEYDALNQLMY